MQTKSKLDDTIPEKAELLESRIMTVSSELFSHESKNGESPGSKQVMIKRISKRDEMIKHRESRRKTVVARNIEKFIA